MANQLHRVLNSAKAADAAGHPAAAAEFYQQAIQLGSTEDRIKYLAAMNLLELGRISDAEVMLDDIRWNALPNPWLIELALGRIQMARFDPVEAEQNFRNAWELHSDSTIPAIFLADCLLQQEKTTEAIDVLNEALNTEGDLAQVHLNLALANRMDGDYKSACEHALKALELTPENLIAAKLLNDVKLCLNSSTTPDDNPHT